MQDYKLTDFLPTTKKELELRGWDSVDVVLFSGDAYIDHPSFGAAVIGRVLEQEGLRVASSARLARRSSRFYKTWSSTSVFCYFGWLYGFYGESLYRQSSIAFQRCLFARWQSRHASRPNNGSVFKNKQKNIS